MEEQTLVNADPYLIIVSKAVSVDAFISGEYSFNNLSSSWSVERRDSAYANMSSWLGWGSQGTNGGIWRESQF
jgi:hypothetical protein